MRKKVYIKTMGCQMNVYDSGVCARLLAPLGYEETGTRKDADLILLNTCAIREKAEQKVFSYLGRLARNKRDRPELMLGVIGCVAQNEGERILRRMPHVDFVAGTHALPRLADLVRRVERTGERMADTGFSGGIIEPAVPAVPGTPGPATAFVTIMQGCDNYCTYCVVPYARGREMSRKPGAIIEEIRQLVESGVREVTLLGQNVNSYARKEGTGTFARLLEMVNDIDGLSRIRFTTSHPRDLSPDMVDCIARLDKLCPHIHLPVQSGSDRILKRMNRGYTVADYLEKAGMLRRACPGMAITSDFIVGFPGETEEEFDMSRELVRAVGFDNLFAFRYSDRPVAPASRFRDKVAEEVKKRRLSTLLDEAAAISREKNTALVGTTQEVLVEGAGRKNCLQWTGRSPTNRVVNFTADRGKGDMTGRLVRVRIEKGYPHSLWGVPDTNPGGRSGTEIEHAA
ncbi:MAG: tRNA (N6-isopentenyl adenosine(37)-C2)-methylthiotransferase MiaB [Desulfatibacillaceae bacterium]